MLIVSGVMSVLNAGLIPSGYYRGIYVDFINRRGVMLLG